MERALYEIRENKGCEFPYEIWEVRDGSAIRIGVFVELADAKRVKELFENW